MHSQLVLEDKNRIIELRVPKGEESRLFDLMSDLKEFHFKTISVETKYADDSDDMVFTILVEHQSKEAFRDIMSRK